MNKTSEKIGELVLILSSKIFPVDHKRNISAFPTDLDPNEYNIGVNEVNQVNHYDPMSNCNIDYPEDIMTYK